ncbi:MAG: GGDEF domain-containing protein [Bacilli bacterium]|nr:GGDEF domain-containing protein [Bacilli bacterium]
MITNMKTFERWRDKIIKIALIVAFIVMITEVVFFFIYYSIDKNMVQGMTTKRYLFLYLILPTVVNFSAVLFCMHINKRKGLDENIKNYFSIVATWALAGCTMCVHYVFPPLICSMIFPIVLTTIFGDKKMTGVFYLSSYIFIFISYLVARQGYFSADPNLMYNYIIGIIITNCTYFSSLILIDYQKDKTLEILKAYQMQMELNEKLKLDQLTGLYNHSAIHKILHDIVEETKKTGKKLHLAMIDIDDFKKVNDTYGHINGDMVIEKLAQIIKEHSGNLAYCSRCGGEEFSVVFPDIETVKAKAILEGALKEFRQYNFGFNKNKSITFSCGLAEYENNEWTSEMFFDIADKTMYVSKAKGKNCITIYEKVE